MGFVRAYEPGDETYLAACLRSADRRELEALSDRTPAEIMRESAERSALSCTVVGNSGLCAGIFGVVDEGDFGRVWLLGTDELVTKPLRNQFLRECHHFLNVMAYPYKCVGNIILASNTVHIRWLKFMNFTFTRRIEKYGLHGETFIEFIRPSHLYKV